MPSTGVVTWDCQTSRHISVKLWSIIIEIEKPHTVAPRLRMHNKESISNIYFLTLSLPTAPYGDIRPFFTDCIRVDNTEVRQKIPNKPCFPLTFDVRNKQFTQNHVDIIVCRFESTM